MKLKIVVFALLGIVLNLNAQNKFPSTGNVGIGTTSPNSKLEIKDGSVEINSSTYSHFKVIRENGTAVSFGVTSNSDHSFLASTGNLSFLTDTESGDQSTKMFLNREGNLGLGSTVPVSKLSLYFPGQVALYPSLISRGDIAQSVRSNNNELEIGNSRGFNDRKAWILARHSAKNEALGKYYSSLHLQPDVGDKSQYRGIAIGYPASEHVSVGTHLAVNGKVGINTLSPDAELTVNGKIHAEEIKVDLSVPGPDYVFKEDYVLRDLKELQEYIKEHGHLPNIPSAKEMETNGVELGTMNMKLLEKIEELVVYTLQQEKKLKDKEEKIEDMERRLEKLEVLINDKL